MLLFKKFLPFILFALGLLLFATYQSKYIATPYFWDELGVYMPAAQHMNDAGTISLLPSSLDPLYSRGHPLLYTFLNASVFHFFGDRVAVAHTFALILSLLVLVSFYFIINNLFSKKIAFLSCLLLAIQPIYISMAVISLPEMLLTLFILWSLWALIKEKWKLFSLVGTLALLTKESAIVVLGVAYIFIFYTHLFKNKNKKNFISFFWISTPLFIYIIFLFIQKFQNGWFFFPEHIGYIHFSFNDFTNSFLIVLKQFFFHKSNFLFGIPAVLYIVYIIVNFKKISSFELVILSFVITSISFACINFYLQRYLIIILPWNIILGIWASNQFINTYLKNTFFKNGLLIIFISISAWIAHRNWDSNIFNDTCDISYRKTVSLVQETANWLQSQTWKNEVIEANFPVFQALQDPRNGYVKQPFVIDVNFQQPCKYGVFFKTKGIWDPLSEHTYEKTLKLFKNDFAEIRVVQFF
jgi:4-amino-4-deoxy-L-arabinose transferase-like glycosyltransferase